MPERLDHRQIRVGQAHVLAHHGHVHLLIASVRRGQERAQGRQVGRTPLEAQPVEHHLVEALLVQAQRHLVDGRRVGAGQHLLGPHVAEQRDLLAHAVLDLVVRAAHDEVGLHADGAQLLHRMLRGLRLHLVRCGYIRHQRHVNEQHVAVRQLLLELARGLDERQRLDVADGAADLGYDDVGAGLVGDAPQARLDGLGDVRNHLHGAAQVVAAPLARDEALVDGSLREVGLAREVLVDEALVVPQVEIAFVPVLGDEHFAVLERRHGSRIHVEVRIHLLHGHLVPARLEQVPQRRGRNALAQRRDDAPGNEDVLGHDSPIMLCVLHMIRRRRLAAHEIRPKSTADPASKRLFILRHARGRSRIARRN